MKVLLLGSGGREHALAWKIAQSPKIEKLYIAPGNAGTSAVGENVAIKATDFPALKAFALEHKIDMIVVGPENPLVQGIFDFFKEDAVTRHIAVIGPSAKGAQLEGSKEFAKEFMLRHHIPTARYKSVTAATLEEGLAFLETLTAPYVLKADGLCAGKGVLILPTLEEARKELKEMLSGMFGDASATVVIEEFLSGIECSVFVLSDGEHYKVLPVAKDYKRIGEGDKGLNTGGMGTFSPSPFYTDEVQKFCEEKVYQPTMDAMKKEGRDFVGILFVGLMLTEDGPKVLEYNARFGDPEAQVVLPRMKNDIIDVMNACIDGKLDEIDLQFEDNAAVCVVLASDGYPEHYEKGKVITGFEKFDGKDGYYVFHAGTKLTDEGIVTNGGRVLGVTAKGKDLKEARKNAYEATNWIDFSNKYMRHDIGKAIDEA